MKLENSFDVDAPPETAWALLMDVPRVIPCMPGAKLLETVDDENWKAQMDVKLGPIGLTFATDVKREATDEAARVARLSARARETRGRGGGQAAIESTLTPTDGGTHVDIVTELSLTGTVAQYGRGLIADVSRQLVDSFAECLRTQPGGDDARGGGSGRRRPGEAGRGRPARAARARLVGVQARPPS